jgi:predicted NAD/FAD-binding protein
MARRSSATTCCRWRPRVCAPNCRDAEGVTVVTGEAGPERFDAIVLASRAPTSLRLLVDADGTERCILGAVRCERNDATLRTDTRLLPCAALRGRAGG